MRRFSTQARNGTCCRKAIRITKLGQRPPSWPTQKERLTRKNRSSFPNSAMESNR
jgi:hypothetical protein